MPAAGWAAFFKALWANAFVRFVVQVAVAYVIARVTAPKAVKARFRGTQTTARGSLEYRKFGYGRAMVGGTIIYMNTRGTDAEWLDYWVAYTDHRIDSLISFRIDNIVVNDFNIDWVPPTVDSTAGTGSGEVNLTTFKGGTTFGLLISWYPGWPNQPANTLLTDEYGLLGASDQAKGVFHAVFQLLYVEETQKMWRLGAPNSLVAVANMRMIYDPRLDTTNGGSGPHRYTDETTWEWSDNPALCIADYLTQYMNVDPTDEIDWPACITAADDCDTLVAIPTAAQQKRFTCNGVWIANEEHEAILEHLKTSMAGQLIYTGGEWVMTAGMYTTPTLTFDANALAGDVQVQGSSGRDARYNQVRGFFSDPSRQYRPVEFQTVEDSAYLTRDAGRELQFDMDLAFVNNDFQAQRIARRALDQFDNQVVATFVMNEQGAKCYPGQFVYWTLPEFSWSSKVFRCIEWRPNEDGTFEVTFQEDFSSRYDDPAEGGYAVRLPGGTVVPATATVPAPTNLVATGGLGSIVLTWDPPPASLYDYVEVWSSQTNDRSGATRKAQVVGSTWTDFTGDTVERFYWVISARSTEEVSIWEPVSPTAGVSGTAASAGLVEWYYIKPLDGTAIHNSVGTLTLETRHVLSGVDSLNAAGSNQLYVGTTLVTVANGYAAGSDGYTGVFDSGDITNDVIVELKDGPTGNVFDSATLVDIADGADGGAGAAGDDGLSVHVSNIYRRSASAPSTPTGGQYVFGGAGLTPPSLWFEQPPAGTDPLYVSIGEWSVQGPTGTDNTTTWSTPAVLVTDGTDGNDGSAGDPGDDGLSIHVSNVYLRASSAPSTPSGGSYNFTTGVLTPPGSWSEEPPAGNLPLYVSIASWSVQGTTGTDSSTTWTSPQRFVENAVYGFIEASNGLAWTRAVNSGDWTPASLTTDLDCTFVQGGTEVARISRRITLTESNGAMASSTTTHPGGDLNTGRVSVSVSGSASTAITVEFAYSFDGQDVVIANTVQSAQGGQDGYSGQIMHSRDWVIPDASPMGNWVLHAGSAARVTMSADIPGPFLEYPLVMEIRGNNNNPGWFANYRWDFEYDGNKSYIFYTWVRRVGSPFPATGLYIGFADVSPGDVDNIAGAPQTNPYTISNQGSIMTGNKWYLAVSVVYASGFGGADQGFSGIYDPASGERVYNGSEFQWNGQQNVETFYRMGFFDSAAPAIGTDEGFDFTRPTGWVRDGSEPSIQAVLGAGAIQGDFKDVKFRRDAAQPATPTGDSPAGWTDIIPAGTNTIWQIVGTKNAQGILQGVWSTPARMQSLTYRGTYSAGTAYLVDDVVSYSERTYICVTNTTGNAPSGTNGGNTWWDLLAGKGDPGDQASFNETIAITGTDAVNLRTLANAAPYNYDGVSDATALFQLGGAITITANPGQIAIDTGTWPSGIATIVLDLEVAGDVFGGGGTGGAGGGFGNGSDGTDGGTAIFCNEDIDIDAQSGCLIQGGGGGGGGGGAGRGPASEPIEYCGGGGGGGEPNGGAGAKGTGCNGGAAGAVGTVSGGGLGGGGGGSTWPAGDGGDGGDDADDGLNGGFGTVDGPNTSGGSSGVGGFGIDKNGKTVNVTGTGQVIGGTET